MCKNLVLDIALLLVSVLVTGGETRSRGKDSGPPQDGAAGLHLHKGLDDCGGEDRNISCESWAMSGECDKDPGVRQSCNFSCSLSSVIYRQLWGAASRGNLSAVNTAIAAGANPLCQNTITQKGETFHSRTAIHLAARANRPGVVKALLDAGVDVNLQTNWDVTPTYGASYNGSIDALNILIEHNADVNLPVIYGFTPLMAAAERGHLRAAKALISANASLDVTGQWGGTALHYAASENKHGVALLLLQSGADTKILDISGRTPASRARSGGHHQLADLIESYTTTTGSTNGS